MNWKKSLWLVGVVLLLVSIALNIFDKIETKTGFLNAGLILPIIVLVSVGFNRPKSN